MRGLLVLVLALATVWGGYWVVGSTAVQRGAEGWFEDQVLRGKVATNAGIDVRGFPNRFDVKVTEPRLADPVSGFGWEAPFAQVYSMSWKPWHLIAALPNSQTITTPDQAISLETSKLLASLKLVPGTALALDGIIINGTDIAATSSLGWVVRAAGAQLATRVAGAETNRHEVNLSVTGLIPDPGLMAALAGLSDLPPLIETARVNAILIASAPIDRFVQDTKPALTGLVIDDALVRWGDMDLTFGGTIRADANGFADGRIDIALTNWRKVLAPAVALGMIKPEVAPTVEKMMALMAGQSGDGSVLKLPLVMNAGRMSLGPLPLGPAPRLVAGPQG